jgi:hypothetical protein
MIKSSGGGAIVHGRNVMRGDVHRSNDRPSNYHATSASETMDVPSSPLNVANVTETRRTKRCRPARVASSLSPTGFRSIG